MPGDQPGQDHVPVPRTRCTRMPTVSAATGCSPTARVRRPQRVRVSPICTPASTMYVMYRKTVESKKTGPMIGMSPSSGIFSGLKVFGLFSVSLYVPGQERVVQVAGEARGPAC